MRSSYKRLGDYIALVDERNVDLKVTTLLGLSISKQFIPSVANTIGTDMKNYKIIRKNQFACSVMQVRRDGKMPVALLSDFDEAIISQAYPVFEIVDTTLLLPEYLMMWFSRSEFDRQATFHAVGGVRGSLEWEDFLDFEIPIPSLETQQEIVNEYQTITKRIDLNEQLNQKLEETAQALYKHWFVDFEFPNEYGEPYKSSGGAMVYNEELDGEIPEGWEVTSVKDFCAEMRSGGTPNRSVLDYWDKEEVPWLKTGEVSNNIVIKAEEFISEQGFKNSSTKLLPIDTVLMAMYGATAGQIAFLKFKTTTNQACCGMICNSIKDAAFLYYHFLVNQKEIANMATGGAQPNLSKNLIEDLRIILPPREIMKIQPLNILIEERTDLTKENDLLTQLQTLLLSKMATVGSEKEIITE